MAFRMSTASQGVVLELQEAKELIQDVVYRLKVSFCRAEICLLSMSSESSGIIHVHACKMCMYMHVP